VNWAIVNDEHETGVTTMKIIEELDAGPILLQRATKIGESETAPELLTRLAETGAEVLSETVHNLKTIEPKPQPNDEATLAPMLKREDGLIDWAMDAFAIDRRVRGFQPWPNAFTTLNSRRLILWKAIPENCQTSSRHGQIMEADGGNLTIACGNATALRIMQLQPEGSRQMTARDFINGTHIEVGAQLGHA
jgi:methionyl-tRNA formyltransferase